ncbi:CDP-alcohol phosphatidyltransferase family protein [Jannaschia formosa]|nr:CDP-alcohol phosphatidyltransferase family protein [Jannaschia formosa]
MPVLPQQRLALAGLAMGPLLALLVPEPTVRSLLPALLGYALGLWLAVRAMAGAYPHGRIGWCNLVTTLRLALVGAIAAAGIGAAPGAPGWTIFALAAVALLLDGVDGFAARRQGLSSAFGARYDMEVDAALAATLAVILLATGRAGAELLVLGFARYAFVAAAAWCPWLAAPLPESVARKTVCVLQIGVLAALTAPAFPEALARPLALTAAALLLWSFGRDIRWLAARR